MYLVISNMKRVYMNKMIDYERLRRTLINDYGAQMIVFSGALGFADMRDVETADNDELLEYAKKNHIDLEDFYINYKGVSFGREILAQFQEWGVNDF